MQFVGGEFPDLPRTFYIQAHAIANSRDWAVVYWVRHGGTVYWADSQPGAYGSIRPHWRRANADQLRMIRISEHNEDGFAGHYMWKRLHPE